MRLRSFLQLLRPPNLFTVPGDPLCGALLATHGQWSWRIAPAMVASLGLYCAGLVVNDIADFAEDLRERPARPLPSGNVKRGSAIALAIFCAAVGLGAAALASGWVLMVALLLLAEILWYNLLAKRNAMLAPVAMGLCRGISVMLGVIAGSLESPTAATLKQAAKSGVTLTVLVAIPPLIAFAAAAIIAIYIGGVTALARTETSNPRIPPLIGTLIRALLFIQAAFCAAAGHVGWTAAFVLIALWPAARATSKVFYAS